MAGKVYGGAVAGAAGGAFVGVASNSSALRYGAAVSGNAMVGMTCFALIQEALRAARGTHDAYNSALAGATILYVLAFYSG